MPYKEVTTTDSDVTIFSCDRKSIYVVVSIEIDNKSGADAVVEIADTFTTEDTSSTSVRNIIFKETVPTGSRVNLSDLFKKVRGDVVASVDNQPIDIVLDVKKL